jgi:hypothetical protein
MMEMQGRLRWGREIESLNFRLRSGRLERGRRVLLLWDCWGFLVRLGLFGRDVAVVRFLRASQSSSVTVRSLSTLHLDSTTASLLSTSTLSPKEGLFLSMICFHSVLHPKPPHLSLYWSSNVMLPLFCRSTSFTVLGHYLRQ